MEEKKKTIILKSKLREKDDEIAERLAAKEKRRQASESRRQAEQEERARRREEKKKQQDGVVAQRAIQMHVKMKEIDEKNRLAWEDQQRKIADKQAVELALQEERRGCQEVMMKVVIII